MAECNEEYEKLNKVDKQCYDTIRQQHPDWSHIQLMAYLNIARGSEDAYIIMRGVGFDIANATQLTMSDKKSLIRGCEDYYFNDKPLSEYHRHLLWRVRKEYHIRNYGLSEQAVPKNFIEKIIF